MLYIKSLLGNIFVLVPENFDLKGNCHGGTFNLNERQVSLCIKKLYYLKKYIYIYLYPVAPFQTCRRNFDRAEPIQAAFSPRHGGKWCPRVLSYPNST